MLKAKSSVRILRVTWPVSEGRKLPHIWNSQVHIAYLLYNFYEATMTIKGRLQVKILYIGMFLKAKTLTAHVSCHATCG